MDDLILKAEIAMGTTLYVSPISRQTYAEHVDDDLLGGGDGYFVIRATRGIDRQEHFEVLAKAASFSAASDLFDLIVANRA